MPQVTIIGAGPAGLTAARTLRDAGIRDILVLERNPEAGGLPRFAGHLGWGMLDFHRLWSGPTYARKLVAAAHGITIATNTTVTALQPGGALEVSGQDGPRRIESQAVLLAAGIREMPRGARLVSGSRPWGVMNTGAFQELVYRGGKVPFRRPVVVGTELVSFSALLTARHLGIRPVAMIEANPRITARRPADWATRLALGVPVRTNTRLVRVEGLDRVEGVVVERDGVTEHIACDGVLLTGRFVPEAALARAGHLAVDLGAESRGTGGPVIDTLWRCSDPAFFAAGNVLRPVEHSGAAALEGRAAARSILQALHGHAPAPDSAIPVSAEGALRYAYPQRVIPGQGGTTLFARALKEHRGRLRLLADGQVLHDSPLHALPERRIRIPLDTNILAGVTRLTAELA